MPASKRATKKGKGSKNEGSEPGYRRKCIELAKRINDINSYNETLVKHIERSKRGMQRLRIERAFLLEQIEKTATAMSKKPKQKNKV